MRKPLTIEQKATRKLYEKQWRDANKKKMADYQKEYRKDNPDSNKTHTKKYRERHPEKSKESSRKYKTKNKIKVESYRVSYKKRRNELNIARLKTDPLYYLKTNIRSAILKGFNRVNIKKNNKTAEILGCSYDEFKLYIELQFESWMNWTNRGKYNGTLNYGWDLDHIIPISTAKTEEDIIKLNHWTNFKPLCSKVNRDIKRNKCTI